MTLRGGPGLWSLAHGCWASAAGCFSLPASAGGAAAAAGAGHRPLKIVEGAGASGSQGGEHRKGEARRPSRCWPLGSGGRTAGKERWIVEWGEQERDGPHKSKLEPARTNWNPRWLLFPLTVVAKVLQWPGPSSWS